MTAAGMFHCDRLHMDLRPEACAAAHRKHRKTSDTIACRRCEVGAQHAGLPAPSVEALWPWKDIRLGDVIAGVEVLSRHPVTYQSSRREWVRWADGNETCESIWSLRRWKKGTTPQRRCSAEDET